MVATDVASRGIGMKISPAPPPPPVATFSRVISAVLYSHVCLGALLIALHLPDLFVLRGSPPPWVTGILGTAMGVPLYTSSALVPVVFRLVQARSWHFLILSSCRDQIPKSSRTRTVMMKLLQTWHLACCRNGQPHSLRRKARNYMLRHHPVAETCYTPCRYPEANHM